jgi:hypothetical protein
MRQRISVSAIHLGLTAAEAYEVLRDMDRHAELTETIRSVRLERTDDGRQISHVEVEMCDGGLADLQGVWSAVEGPEGCRIGFDGRFDLGMPARFATLGPAAARTLRDGITAQLEEMFGPALLVDRALPREPAPTAGI